MKAIELNLAGNPYRNDSPLTLGLVTLGVIALFFTAYNAYAYFSADATKSGLQAQLVDHRQQMDAMRTEEQAIRKQLSEIDAEVLFAQAEFVSGVLEQRNFSWTALLNALEETLPWNVRLSVIRPSFERGSGITVSLRGVAQNYAAFLHFQDALEHAQRFDDVAPGSWQYVTRDANADERIFFDLACRYKPAESGEAQEEAAVLDATGGEGGSGSEVIVVTEGEGEDAGTVSGVGAGTPSPRGATVEPRAARRAGSTDASSGGGAPSAPGSGVGSRGVRQRAGGEERSRADAVQPGGEPAGEALVPLAPGVPRASGSGDVVPPAQKPAGRPNRRQPVWPARGATAPAGQPTPQMAPQQASPDDMLTRDATGNVILKPPRTADQPAQQTPEDPAQEPPPDTGDGGGDGAPENGGSGGGDQ